MNNIGDWLKTPDKEGFSIHQRVCSLFARGPIGGRLITLEKVPELYVEAGWAEMTVVVAPAMWFSWSTGERVSRVALIRVTQG